MENVKKSASLDILPWSKMWNWNAHSAAFFMLKGRWNSDMQAWKRQMFGAGSWNKVRGPALTVCCELRDAPCSA